MISARYPAASATVINYTGSLALNINGKKYNYSCKQMFEVLDDDLEDYVTCNDHYPL